MMPNITFHSQKPKTEASLSSEKEVHRQDNIFTAKVSKMTLIIVVKKPFFFPWVDTQWNENKSLPK